jgi:hypothetical protein
MLKALKAIKALNFLKALNDLNWINCLISVRRDWFEILVRDGCALDFFRIPGSSPTQAASSPAYIS